LKAEADARVKDAAEKRHRKMEGDVQPGRTTAVDPGDEAELAKAEQAWLEEQAESEVQRRLEAARRRVHEMHARAQSVSVESRRARHDAEVVVKNHRAEELAKERAELERTLRAAREQEEQLRRQAEEALRRAAEMAKEKEDLLRHLEQIEQEEARRLHQLEAMERQHLAQAAGRARVVARHPGTAHRPATATTKSASAPSAPLPAWRVREQKRQEERMRREAAGELEPVNRPSIELARGAAVPPAASEMLRRSQEDQQWATLVDQSESTAAELHAVQQRDHKWASSIQ